MGKISKYIGKQFSRPHGIMGRICCFLQNVANKKMYRKVATCIPAVENSRVLDIGYGNGHLIKKIYKKSKPEIYGIDISEDMLKLASKRNKKGIKCNKIHLSVGDCCSLTFNDCSFDFVTSVNTVYFWKDTLKGLTEICRVLKSGGYFYNVLYSKEFLQKLSYTKESFKFFEKEDFLSLGKQAGFFDIEITDISKGNSYLVKMKKA